MHIPLFTVTLFRQSPAPPTNAPKFERSRKRWVVDQYDLVLSFRPTNSLLFVVVALGVGNDVGC